MPTILDIARLANVAPSTVSRVLNGRFGVSEKTKETVLKVAAELGYHPNAPARALVGGRTNTLGILVYKVSEPYYAGILNGASDAANQSGYYIIFANTNDERLDKIDPINNLFAQGRVDGMMVVGGSLRDDEFLTKLTLLNMPYVLVERFFTDPRINCIDVDNIQGAYLATNHLIKLGHRRIGHLAGDPNWQQTCDRIIGYHRALQEMGFPPEPELQMFCYFNGPKGYQGMERLLDLPQPPTAVFAADDETAFGAINAVYDRGLRVPDDIAIVGFDDVPQASWSRPHLTTIHQPTYAMGEMAVKTLIQDIEGTLTGKVKKVFPLELIIRESCGYKKREKSL